MVLTGYSQCVNDPDLVIDLQFNGSGVDSSNYSNDANIGLGATLVSNQIGQVVLHSKNLNTGIHNIDMTPFRSGMYTVKFKSQRGERTFKILKIE